MRFRPWGSSGKRVSDAATPYYSHRPPACPPPTSRATQSSRLWAADRHTWHGKGHWASEIVSVSVWISFRCCTWGKEGKSRDTWFVLEFSVAVSHWVHYPTCIFSNAGDPVQVPFWTQPSVWGPFVQLHIDFVHCLPSADNLTTQWYHVLSWVAWPFFPLKAEVCSYFVSIISF